MNNWYIVQSAADRLYNILINPRIINATDEVYNGVLSRIMETIFTIAYIKNFDRNNPDIQILLEAWSQLNQVGNMGNSK